MYIGNYRARGKNVSIASTYVENVSIFGLFTAITSKCRVKCRDSIKIASFMTVRLQCFLYYKGDYNKDVFERDFSVIY